MYGALFLTVYPVSWSGMYDETPKMHNKGGAVICLQIVQKYLSSPAKAEMAMCPSGGNFMSPMAVLTAVTAEEAEM